jgi:citrate lyase subunit beta/citryl-CoA lyase
LLFCPGDRPDRYDKAAARSDVVIVDLEDAVGVDRKPDARRSMIGHPLDPIRTIVRVNPAGGIDHDADMVAVSQTSYDVVMLAKTESREQVESLNPYRVIALCETARGVADARDISRATNLVGMMWGAEDLMGSLGGGTSRHGDGQYRDIARLARSTILLAASAQGINAIDAVFLDINDPAGLNEESAESAHIGFAAKACIHPAQVDVVRHAFRPLPSDIAWATSVLAESGNHSGVFQFEGMMIDEPILRQARRTMDRAR